MKKIKSGDKVSIEHSQFLNKDGYRNGGVEVEMTNPQETQSFEVQGQKVMPEKKRNAKLY